MNYWPLEFQFSEKSFLVKKKCFFNMFQIANCTFSVFCLCFYILHFLKRKLGNNCSANYRLLSRGFSLDDSEAVSCVIR